MRAYETYSDISSTLDYQNLSTIDESEALGILASLGKKYYKSAGMGKSLEIDKLRQLQGEYSRSFCFSLKATALPTTAAAIATSYILTELHPTQTSLKHLSSQNYGTVREKYGSLKFKKG